MFSKPAYRKRTALAMGFAFIGQSTAVLVINKWVFSKIFEKHPTNIELVMDQPYTVNFATEPKTSCVSNAAGLQLVSFSTPSEPSSWTRLAVGRS
jgi:hypothetical protein